jgi:peptide-N4-(N-acetyl-beta-glucosaminyl)asparagine amidase
LSYCIAFSADGCSDVTRRYVRDASTASKRNRCSEGDLIHIVREIKAMRRKDMDKKERFDLMAQDSREDEEFRRYVIESLAFTISRILPGGDATKSASQRSDPDAQKAAEARREAEILRARGGRNAPSMPRPGQ